MTQFAHYALGGRSLLLALCLAIGGPAYSQSQQAAPDHVRPDLSDASYERVQAVTEFTEDFSQAESFEVMQGGAGTVDKRVNADIFSHPAANLSFEERQQFLVGNGLFRKDWVSSPSSTLASDGLGPLFNARSCQACHVKDGRGTVPGFDPEALTGNMALLIRLSLAHNQNEAVDSVIEALEAPDPVYGHQFQPFAVPGLSREGDLQIRYESQEVALNGGETVELMKPVYELTDLAYGPLHKDVRLSPRLASPMIGLGLLEAIHPNDILRNINRPEAKKDGVSGRVRWVEDLETGEKALGRFGWKAEQPSVKQQAAVAFSADMGLSTPLVPSPYGECTFAQKACFKMPHGVQNSQGAHEVPGELLDFVSRYSENLALPQRRNVNDVRVLAGKKLFYEANCVACHVPKYVTRRDATHPAHQFQLIWPYTDMLLHDMGPDLADEGGAWAREWRTPPLWGIGLTKTVNPNATWLHDGRARTLLEAIMWHGGEAQAARDRVAAMTPEDRDNLLKFLESL